MNKYIISPILLYLSLSLLPTYAKSFNEGVRAFQQKDFSEAYDIFKTLGSQKMPEAKYYLALMYDQGKGVSKNYSEAAKLYHQAANLGYAEAQYNLSIMFRTGDGVQKNYNESVKWARLAAEQGHSEALYYLSGLYELGLGVTANPVMAQTLKILAAEKSHSLAKKSINHSTHLLTDDQLAEARTMAARWHKGKPLPLYKDFTTLRKLN